MFEKGMKVVCVKTPNHGPEDCRYSPRPKKDEINTISGLHIDNKEKEGLFLILEGYPQDIVYSCSCFVPLDDITEIEVIEEMIVKTTEIEELCPA